MNAKLSNLKSLRQKLKEAEQEIERLKENVKYQSAVAVLAQRALAERKIQDLMNEAVVLVSKVLVMEFCEVLELLPDHKNFFMRASVGWMGTASTLSQIPATVESVAGCALFSDVPVIIEDLRTESKFAASPALYEHNVISGISVKIHREGQIYGVLGAFTDQERVFPQSAVYFMETIANILATATQEKRKEKMLRESLERLHLASEAQNQVIWDWDLLTDSLCWSIELETVFGYKEKEVDWQFKRQKTHPDDREQVDQVLQAFLRSGKRKWSDIYRFARADGSYANVRDQGIVLYNETGKAVRMVGSMTEFVDKQRETRRGRTSF